MHKDTSEITNWFFLQGNSGKLSSDYSTNLYLCTHDCSSVWKILGLFIVTGQPGWQLTQVVKKLIVVTFRAQRSVSRPCPIRMVSALMKLIRVSCTSLREVWLPLTSSSLMPENLDKQSVTCAINRAVVIMDIICYERHCSITILVERQFA